MDVIVRVVIRGRVQGVGFRAWTEGIAAERELEGWVRNRRDGSVEAVFGGTQAAVRAPVPPGSARRSRRCDRSVRRQRGGFNATLCW